MKTCKACLRELAVSDFHRDSQRSDGRYPYCKTCKLKLGASYRSSHRVEKAAYDAGRYRADRATKLCREAERTRTLRATDPERMRLLHRANMAVNYALRTGRLNKATACEQCGRSELRIVAAHRNYERPYLDVLWLCDSCHSQWDQAEPKLPRTSCHNHGEVECDGCPDCEPELDDSDLARQADLFGEGVG